MKASRILLVAAVLGLCGCGRVTDLQPAKGDPLPVKPLLARTTPTATELLTPPAYARPVRVDDLVTRSEPRKPDPFDLPPPTGGVAPPPPAGADQQPVTNDTGVAPKD
jgi:hypothetical protein